MAEAKTPSVGDHLGNSGALPTVKWGDREMTVAYCTPVTISMMEIHIAKQAMQEADEIGNPAMIDKTASMIAARQHRAMGKLWNALRSWESDCLLLWACIKQNHPDFKFEDAITLARESRSDVRVALEIVRPDFYAGLAKVTPYTIAEIKAMYGETPAETTQMKA